MSPTFTASEHSPRCMPHSTLPPRTQRCSVVLTCINVPGGTAECHGWAWASSLLILVSERGAALIQRLLERKSEGKGMGGEAMEGAREGWVNLLLFPTPTEDTINVPQLSFPLSLTAALLLLFF